MDRLSRRAFVRGGAGVGLGVAAGFGPERLRGHGRAAARPAVAAGALADLRKRLNGTLLLPGDSGYPSASAPTNARFREVWPAAVARCANEADIVACVRWCTEHGVAPVVRGGGHSYAGYSTTTGLLIDLRRLNGVRVDRRAGTMVVGGAALNADLFVALENGPLFLPGGICPTVGVGGLTLGGGIGHNARWAGLTCDRLRSSRVVTAAGAIVDVDAETNADLFWACKGGAGGSFGVNTSFTFELVDVPRTDVAWFSVQWRGADAATAVLSGFSRLLQTAPPGLGGFALAQTAGPGDEREAIDVLVEGRYVGSARELRDLIDPLLATAAPVEQELREMPFWEAQRLLAEPATQPHAFTDTSRYADEPLPDAAVATVVDLLTECPIRSADAYGTFVTFGWVGGAVNDVDRTATAYVHRGMTALHRAGAAWPADAPAAVGDAMTAWSESVVATIAPSTPNESYQNFPNRAIADWQQQYYAENFARLVDVKTAHDPRNLFNNPQSIPPRATS